MKFICKLAVPKDFFAPTYLLKHTTSFRRITSQMTLIESINYHTWSFTSPKIRHGCALIPSPGLTYILILSLEPTEDIYTASYRLNSYLLYTATQLAVLAPNTSLFINY